MEEHGEVEVVHEALLDAASRVGVRAMGLRRPVVHQHGAGGMPPKVAGGGREVRVEAPHHVHAEHHAGRACRVAERAALGGADGERLLAQLCTCTDP